MDLVWIAVIAEALVLIAVIAALAYACRQWRKYRDVLDARRQSMHNEGEIGQKAQ